MTSTENMCETDNNRFRGESRSLTRREIVIVWVDHSAGFEHEFNAYIFANAFPFRHLYAVGWNLTILKNRE